MPTTNYIPTGRYTAEKTCEFCHNDYMGVHNQRWCPDCKAIGVGEYAPRKEYTVYMLYVDGVDKVYIGKTSNLGLRLRGHKSDPTSAVKTLLDTGKDLKVRILAQLESQRDMTWLEQNLRHWAPHGLLLNRV